MAETCDRLWARHRELGSMRVSGRATLHDKECRSLVYPSQIALQAAVKSQVRRSGRLLTEPCVWWKLRFCNS